MDQEAAEPGRPPTFSIPGLILLGPSAGHITCNTEAIQILAYPNRTVNVRRMGQLVTERIPFSLKAQQGFNDVHRVAELLSGKRRYICSLWHLNVHGADGLSTIAVLLERQAAPNVVMHELCAQFHLTTREKQAVAFLVRGLTSKEIAQHMGISPNTVKSFLRLVMTKAGVSTRAGLIGKVAGITLQPASVVKMPPSSEVLDRGSFATKAVHR